MGLLGEPTILGNPPQNTPFVRKGHFSNLQWHIGDVGMWDPTGQQKLGSFQGLVNQYLFQIGSDYQP